LSAKKITTQNFDPFAKGYFPLYLAPMANFTDFGFRSLCKEQGADVLITEFVMADAIIFGGESAWSRIDFDDSQRPMGVQIFGSNPEYMGEAAKRIMDRLEPDFIDMNFGCPAERVTCQDAGSSLLRDLNKLGNVAQSVVQSIPDKPVTAKIRIGWDHSSIIATDAGLILEDAGIKALAIHGRTKEQGYSGSSDWNIIQEVHQRLKIPVIGNGDIRTAEDVIRIMKEDRCSGVMIGRAALGYPWIFREIRQFINTGEKIPPPSLEERWIVILDYCRNMFKTSCGEESQQNIMGMRAKIAGLTKEMLGCKRLRPEIMKLNRFGELIDLASKHLDKHGSSLRRIWQ
jgi:tRNA-dihydrouridine synthase B